MVIEVYGGVVQNAYVAHEAPETQVEAVIVDWDYESYDAPGDCLVHATGLDGAPALACVSTARLKPWRLLAAAGIQDVLDRAGLADFGSQPLTDESVRAARQPPRRSTARQAAQDERGPSQCSCDRRGGPRHPLRRSFRRADRPRRSARVSHHHQQPKKDSACP
jgi:hypothetical protein